jgi:hypothetical protein
MRPRHNFITTLTIAALIVAPVALGGCGRSHQYYDPYYSDYHRWNGTEDGFYRRWEGETGRQHMDFGHRSVGEQHSYFDWRHKH